MPYNIDFIDIIASTNEYIYSESLEKEDNSNKHHYVLDSDGRIWVTESDKNTQGHYMKKIINNNNLKPNNEQTVFNGITYENFENLVYYTIKQLKKETSNTKMLTGLEYTQKQPPVDEKCENSLWLYVHNKNIITNIGSNSQDTPGIMA